jgi:hypothetical protein
MGKGDRLGDRAMSRFDVFHMIKRRAEAAALPYSTCCHTFRATGITTYCAASIIFADRDNYFCRLSPGLIDSVSLPFTV